MSQDAALRHEGYLPRYLDRRIEEGLEDFGAVCIQGSKYCGKTWAAQNVANSEINLLDPAGNFQNMEIARLQPELAIQGAAPRLIDEWQEVPVLWDAVRNAVDRSDKQRTFLLTGSSVPREEKPHHSGVGRIEKMRMRPMSLAESGESSKAVSLAGLFAGERPSCAAPSTGLETLVRLAVRGGWPALLKTPASRAARLPRSYVSELQNDDMSRVDGVSRDPEKVARLLHSLARNAEQATATKTMVRDMTETANEPPLAKDTVDDYLDALKKIFILEELSPWAPNLRSPLRINKRPKYHFVDPSIPAAVISASEEKLMKDLEAFGFIFECMCVRDILIYAEAMDASVHYYRDRNGLEVDLVVESSDGDWAGIELKLGHHQVDSAAANLKSLSRKIVEAGGEEPAFLAVVEGVGDYAYEREDGVMVVPIMTLAG